MVKDDERCIRCGLCAIRCPTDAMTMERFTITERWAAVRDARRGRRGRMSDKPDRRDFLLKLGTGGGVCALGAQATASLRSLVPNVSYDAPTTVKLGPPADFPDGLKFLPDERLFVFREGNTFHAISAVCTHLGCTVRAEALSQPGGPRGRRQERCASPTASSARATARTTQGDGTNVSGPAPKPLAWYRLSVAPDDGQLVVDLADEVGQRLPAHTA